MKNAFSESFVLLDALRKNEPFLHKIDTAANTLIRALRAGHKVLWCGNGGSAADCQHLSAELVARLAHSRKALASLALTTDTSYLTAWINDTGQSDHLFSRQIEALGKKGDVLIAVSTSGNSKNVIAAVAAAKNIGMETIVLSGNTGGKLAGTAETELIVPASDTQRIQEIHMIIGHMICEQVENAFLRR